MKTNQALPILVGCLLALFALSAWALASKEAHIRSGNGLCEEVDAELGEAVRSGLLEPDAARLVSQRCYDRFGANSYD